MPHLVRLPQVSKSLLISSLTFLLIFTSLPPLAYSAPELGPVKSINGARASLKSSTQPNSDIKQEGVKEAVASRSLSFEANQGQADGNVKFLSRGNGYSLFLTSNEAVLSLRAPAAKPSMAKEPKRGSEPEKSPVGEAAVLRMRLEGANKNPRIEGLERQTGVANYFRGNDPKKWREGVSTYARVKYHQVYSGIDLVYYSRKQELEYDFIVAPGADVRSIRLSFGGAEKVEINDQGELVLKTKAGEVRHRKPVIYQEAGGKRQEVSGRYVMRGKRQVGFEVGEYDRTRPLVIDPVIAYSTLLGGSNDAFGSYSFANGIATHTAADGTVYTYVVGTTVANDFPIRNGWQSIYSGAGDVFVVKLKMSASGDASLVYSTFLGGDHSEQGWGIAVDVGGNAYVAGLTHSRNFPIRNAPQASHGGGTFDAFIAKLNADGSELEYSTYLGGSGDDRANSIAIDSAGNAYLTGQTTSGNFPPVNAYSTVYGSRNTIFVAKIAPPSNGNSASLAYSTYLGGSGYTNGDNSGNGVAVDSAGNAYVTGITAAPNFPIVNGFQTELQCSVGNAFVAKLNPSASGPASLLYSTYIGGLCPFGTGDTGTGIAVDSAGKAYVTGTTVSQDFPTTPGAFTRDYRTGFVAKIDPSKSGTESLIYSTFLGGASPDVSHRGRSIAVDADGNAYVTGSTISFDFPLVNSIQSFNSGAFQSINGGDSWVGINNGLTIPTINALAIDTSTSPRTLYAGAADYHHFTGGVFKSTNGGASWSGTNTGLTNTDVRTLVISPTDPSTLYVATGGGIFRSVNGGSTWSELNTGLSGAALTSIRVLAFDTQTTPATLYAGSKDGLYKISGDSSNWSFVDVGEYIALAIDTKTTPSTLHVTDQYGLYKSENGGSSWTTIAPGSAFCCAVLAFSSIVVDTTTTPSTLYGNSLLDWYPSRMWKSTDGGNTWENLPGADLEFMNYGPMQQLTVDASTSPSTIYAGSQFGFFKSADGGTSWEDVNRIGVGAIAVDSTTATATTPSVLYIGKISSETDAFVAKLNSTGSALLFSTVLGSPGEDIASGIALDSSGNIYLAGSTNGGSFTTVNAYQQTQKGATDAFVLKLGSASIAPPPGCSADCSVTTEVALQTGKLEMSFPSLTSAGETSVTPIDNAATANLQLSENLGAYEISTTAGYYVDPAAYASDPTQGIKISFTVSTVNDERTFNNLVVTHGETINGAFQMVPYDGLFDPNKVTYRDFATRRVWVYVPHLSPFIILKGAGDQIADLAKLVHSFNLKQGINNSLDAKLQNTVKAYQAAAAKDRATACNLMGAFTSELQSQSGKAITPAQAQQLLAAARQIRVVLGCR